MHVVEEHGILLALYWLQNSALCILYIFAHWWQEATFPLHPQVFNLSMLAQERADVYNTSMALFVTVRMCKTMNMCIIIETWNNYRTESFKNEVDLYILIRKCPQSSKEERLPGCIPWSSSCLIKKTPYLYSYDTLKCMEKVLEWYNGYSCRETGKWRGLSLLATYTFVLYLDNI